MCGFIGWLTGTSFNMVAKVPDWGLEGEWLKPQSSHDKIRAAFGPLSAAFNPTFLYGIGYFVSQCN